MSSTPFPEDRKCEEVPLLLFLNKEDKRSMSDYVIMSHDELSQTGPLCRVLLTLLGAAPTTPCGPVGSRVLGGPGSSALSCLPINMPKRSLFLPQNQLKEQQPKCSGVFNENLILTSRSLNLEVELQN